MNRRLAKPLRSAIRLIGYAGLGALVMLLMSTGVIAATAPFHPFLGTLNLILLGTGFYVTYFRHRGAEEDAKAPLPQRLLLWATALPMVLWWSFSLLALFFLGTPDRS